MAKTAVATSEPVLSGRAYGLAARWAAAQAVTSPEHGQAR